MEVQTESVEPPLGDLQPAGKINKAAFKLFGKRRTGSGMASFFSFRNKGASNSGNCDNGNSVNGNGSASSVELVRSKTHDGLTGANNDAEGPRGEGSSGMEVGPVRSLSKSFSFFSLLRRGSFRSSENGAGLHRRGRGLKGFFSSMRWRRKEKTSEGDGEEVESRKETAEDVGVSEKVPDATLTLEPPPHHHQENSEKDSNTQPEETPTTSVTMTPTHCVAMPGPSGEPDSPFTFTPTDSPLHPSVTKAKASISSLTPSLATPPSDRSCAGDPPSEPTMDRLCSLLFNDVTSLKSFDSLTGCGDIIADADEETTAGNGGSGTSSSSSGGGGGGNAGSSVARPVGLASTTSKSSPSKLPHFTQPMFSTPSSALPVSLPGRIRIPPTLQQPPAGSGVVAYMGGGEEMASPEGVDDADMQGLWHMLPSTGDDSPALPRTNPPSSTTPTSTFPPRTSTITPSSHIPLSSRSVDRKVPQVKSLGLSKIPVVGGAAGRGAKPPLPHSRHPTSPGDKELLSDEGYWDTPSATPTATPDESGLQNNQNIGLSRDSCSGDHLYDLYNDPEGDDLNSTPSPSTEYKLSPGDLTTPPSSSSSSSNRSIKGSASLPRESKIPVSSRHATPPHSSSQTALSSVVETECPQPKTQAPPRSKIPTSKVPVRRSGNKPNSSAKGNTSKK